MGVVHLVRHGQASFGAEVYDKLSPLGRRQSALLGVAMAGRQIEPELVLAGAMVRHQETANAALSSSGWATSVHTDDAWNEFDHEHVLVRHPQQLSNEERLMPATFQSWFERATARWSSGNYDDDYREPFSDFGCRVEGALHRVAQELGAHGTAVVFTSGGVIAWLATSLLSGGAVQWQRLNRVVANTGCTTAVFGRNGMSLVSFNDHSHLRLETLTYR